jgi:hypothetical protein
MESTGQLHSLVASPSGKEPRYPLTGKLAGPQIRSGGLKNINPLDPAAAAALKHEIAS